MKFHQRREKNCFITEQAIRYVLTGFVFLPLVPGRNPFLAAEDEGCVGVAICCGCITGGDGTGRGGTD